MYRCPVCTADLESDGRAYRCGRGHSFDVARDGYVNLLAGPRTRARPSGDDVAMVRARRAVLDSGHFDRLRTAVLERVGAGSVLDAGCGEGFYSRPLADRAHWVGAIDLSKAAVRLAARRADGIEYAVANAFRMPVHDRGVQTVMSVFGPLAGAEIRRVLTAGGHAVVVRPAADHLAQLKRVLFREPIRHPADAAVAFGGHLRRLEADRVTYEVDVEQPTLSALLAMTPYAWRTPRAAVHQLAAVDRMTVTLDFLVITFRHE